MNKFLTRLFNIPYIGATIEITKDSSRLKKGEKYVITGIDDFMSEFWLVQKGSTATMIENSAFKVIGGEGCTNCASQCKKDTICVFYMSVDGAGNPPTLLEMIKYKKNLWKKYVYDYYYNHYDWTRHTKTILVILAWLGVSIVLSTTIIWIFRILGLTQ